MKKHWKMVVGVLCVIGGIANFGDNNIAAVLGLIIGIGFLVWWYLTRNKKSSSQKTGYTFIGSTDSNKYHWPTGPRVLTLKKSPKISKSGSNQRQMQKNVGITLVINVAYPKRQQTIK